MSATGVLSYHCHMPVPDTERSLSPVLFCLDSEYAANATQGTSQVHKKIERGKQLYLEDAGQVGSPLLMFQATVRFLETSEQMSLRREVRPA